MYAQLENSLGYYLTALKTAEAPTGVPLKSPSPPGYEDRKAALPLKPHVST